MIKKVETCAKGKVFPEYYIVTVEIGHWDTIHKKVIDWCLDNFGIDSRDNWYCNLHGNGFFFTKQEDMLLFILKWS